jgi:uncharacterized protein YraI
MAKRILTGGSARWGALACALIFALLAVTPFAATAQLQFGTGWTAQYFNNTDLSGSPVFTTSAPNGVNFNWGTGSPDATVQVDNFSARFTSIQFFNAGVYEFIAISDDGIRVQIDGVTVLDRFQPRVLTEDRFQQTLTAGTHAITVEYVEFGDQAIVQFQWQQIAGGGTPGIGTPIVGTPGVSGFPTPFGTPPIQPTAVYTGPLATVTGVRGLALRTGPYVGASFVTTLTQDQSFPVVARSSDEGIYNWYLLQVGERRGWASGRFLTISVDRNLLPLQTTVFDQIDAAPDLNVVGVTRAVMNMRRRPSPRTGLVGSIPWGAPVSIIGRTTQAGTDRWYQVRYNGVVGWIDAAFVTVQGERFAVPVR